MHHSVPPPALPPDPEDLYTPPQHLRVGQMAGLVWLFMRLASTNTDWAWCTVCKRWYRYRSDFNDTYIKNLFKHCKTQHIVTSDGKVKPNPSNPNFAAAPTALAAASNANRLLQLQQQQQSGRQSTRQVVQQPLLRTPLYAPHAATTQRRPISLPPAPASASVSQRYSHSQAVSQLTHQVQQFRARRAQEQRQLAHAHATRAHLAALAAVNTPAQNNSGVSAPASAPGTTTTQQQFDAAMANITAGLARRASSPQQSQTTPAVNSLPQIVTVPAGRAGVPVSMQWAPVANVARPGNSQVHLPPRQHNINDYGSAVAQERSLLLQQMQLVGREINAARQVAVDGSNTEARVASAGVSEGLQQTRSVPVLQPGAAPSASHGPINAKEMGSVVTGSKNVIGKGLGAGGVMHSNQISQSLNGVNNLAGVSKTAAPHIGSQSVSISTGVTGNSPMPEQPSPRRSQPSSPTASPSNNKTLPSASALSKGAITKKTANPTVSHSRPVRKRCDPTPEVCRVAERSQKLMFDVTKCYFANAVFQVPSTAKEAQSIKTRGTTDVDRGENFSYTDLYFISWSHTQMFAAQMAALGYRFVSCNLKGNPKQTEPPPLQSWLYLEKYHHITRSLSTSSAANSPPTVKALESSQRQSQQKQSAYQNPGSTPPPKSGPSSVAVSVPSNAVITKTSTPTRNLSKSAAKPSVVERTASSGKRKAVTVAGLGGTDARPAARPRVMEPNGHHASTPSPRFSRMESGPQPVSKSRNDGGSKESQPDVDSARQSTKKPSTPRDTSSRPKSKEIPIIDLT